MFALHFIRISKGIFEGGRLEEDGNTINLYTEISCVI